jgi:hypothetical protein
MSFKRARGQWLTPVILATQEDHGSKPAWANCSSLPYLQKHFTKIRLVECLKVKTLSLSPSNSKKKKKKKTSTCAISSAEHGQVAAWGKWPLPFPLLPACTLGEVSDMSVPFSNQHLQDWALALWDTHILRPGSCPKEQSKGALECERGWSMIEPGGKRQVED